MINYICYNLNCKVKVVSPLIITISIVMDMVHSLHELLEEYISIRIRKLLYYNYSHTF